MNIERIEHLMEQWDMQSPQANLVVEIFTALKNSAWYPIERAEEIGAKGDITCLVYGMPEDDYCEGPDWFDARWEESDQAFIICHADVKIINPQKVKMVKGPEVIRA